MYRPLIVFGAVLGICGYIYVQKSSVLEPVLWVSPNPLPKLSGVYAPNNYLTNGLRKIYYETDASNRSKGENKMNGNAILYS